MTIVHGSLGSFVTSFHRYHSSLGPFFLTVFDRRAHLATLGSVDDKGRRNRGRKLRREFMTASFRYDMRWDGKDSRPIPPPPVSPKGIEPSGEDEWGEEGGRVK